MDFEINSRMLTVIDDSRGRLEIEFFNGLAFIHSEFRRKVSAMRAARELFPQLKLWLRRMGHAHCYVCIAPEDDLLYRFERSFGFRDLCFYKGFRIMAQEC